MKKYIILLIALTFNMAIWAQTVPTKALRIQDATTALGQNIPVGTLVFNMATQETYVATAGVAGTANLTTAAASFKLIGDTTTVTDNLTSTSTTEALSANQGKVLEDTKLNKTLADGRLFVGNDSDEATAVVLSGDATLANDGTITIEDDAVDGSDISLTNEAEGDMTYYNGTEWVRLPKGTANQSLVMNSGATAPEWQSGGTTEDKEVILGSATGGDGTTIAIPANVSDYQYLRLESDNWTISSVEHAVHGTVLVSDMASKRILIYAEAINYLHADINASRTSLEIHCTGTADWRLVGIKAQKIVINPADATVIDDDTFASASSSNVPSAESVKAYVDANGFSIANEAEGDMAYFNGTDWVRLPKGTANQSLVMNSGATAPEWQSGGAMEDVSTLLFSVNGATNNSIHDIGVNWGDLHSLGYEYVEFRSTGGEANNRLRYVSRLATKDWVDYTRIAPYNDGISHFTFIEMNASASTFKMIEGLTAWDSVDIEVYGIKAQKAVIDPSLTTVIDDDTFASASSSNVPSAESVKALVDDTVQAMVEHPSLNIRYIDIGDVRIQWGQLTVTGSASLNIYAMSTNTSASSLTTNVLVTQGDTNVYTVNGNVVDYNTITFNVFVNGAPSTATIKWMMIGPKP